MLLVTHAPDQKLDVMVIFLVANVSLRRDLAPWIDHML